jgi:16S rRNA G966 N2-methylase RsmD
VETLTGCAPLLKEGGRVVFEHAKTEVLPPLVAGLERVDQREFGATVLSIFTKPLTSP